MTDRLSKIPRNVVDACYTFRPEDGSVSPLPDGSYESEEGGLSAKSFPSTGSTVSCRKPMASGR